MEIEKKYQIKEMPCLDGAMTKEMEQAGVTLFASTTEELRALLGL